MTFETQSNPSSLLSRPSEATQHILSRQYTDWLDLYVCETLSNPTMLGPSPAWNKAARVCRTLICTRHVLVQDLGSVDKVWFRISYTVSGGVSGMFQPSSGRLCNLLHSAGSHHDMHPSGAQRG